MSKFIENDDFKCISFIGMSGIGKSHNAAIMEHQAGWYHFSVDYLIGNYYLADQILNHDQVTKEDITPITNFLGLMGNPDKGGTDYKSFRRRQRLYHDAEVLASQALPEFIRIAKEQNFPGLINDTAGSFVELNYDELPEIIAEHSLIVYIEASDADKNAIFERAKSSPKPLMYPEALLKNHIEKFMADKGLESDVQIDPKEFFDYIFPLLFEQRLPKYKAVADKYGCTVSSDDIKSVQSPHDFMSLIRSAL